MNVNGRHLAYLGIGLGGVISVYGNVAEEYLHPHPADDAVILAAAAPVVLLVMTELLTVVRGRGAAAWVVRLATVGVAAVAFSTSYQHLRSLLLARGESASTGALYPLGIDGLLLGAAAVLWQIRTSGDAVAEVVQEVVQDVVEDTPAPVEAPAAVEVPEAVQEPARSVRRAPRTKAPAKAEPATDEALLGRLQDAVDAGDLTPSDVTTNRCRTLLGVGAGRAGRLAEQWQNTHRRAALAAVAH